MNIVLFIGSLSDGGAERVACNLSNYLSKSNVVTVLTMSNEPAAYNLDEKVKRVSLSREGESDNFLVKNLKRVIRFRRYIKGSLADVYIVMLPVTINIILLNRKLIKVPVIISERCDPKTRYESSKLKKWIMQRLYPKADGFVFQTQNAKSYYSDYIGGRGIIIPNAINKEFIREPYKGKREKVIVSAGRLSKQKNFLLLIEAFSKISKKHTDYKLIIYGEGALRSILEERIIELKLNDRVFMPGYVHDLGSYLLSASLFVLSSDFEGMPNALIEAMALGLPCISTDCPAGGPKYLINNGENGLLVPVGEASKLADAMDKVFSNEDFASRIGNNAREITENLKPDKIYKRWELYINQIVTQTHKEK